MYLWRHIRDTMPLLHTYIVLWLALTAADLAWIWLGTSGVLETTIYISLSVLLCLWCWRALYLELRARRTRAQLRRLD